MQFLCSGHYAKTSDKKELRLKVKKKWTGFRDEYRKKCKKIKKLQNQLKSGAGQDEMLEVQEAQQLEQNWKWFEALKELIPADELYAWSVIYML